MALLAWNVRRLGNKDTVRALKNICFKHKNEIVFLSETKQKRRYLEKIRMRMKMDNAFYVDPVGIAGGLALWWSNDVKLSVLNHDKNFIDTVISINGEDVWFGTFIYAPPYEEEKQEFWERLGSLRNDVNAKWCIMRDTNIVASPNEKFGGLPFDFNSAKWFHEFLDRSYLMEIHSKGGAYTWSNQRCEEDEICEKLDRVLSSSEWSFLFPKAIALIEVPIASDRAPIVLLTKGVKKKARTEFKFESRWTLEEECSNIIQEEWAPTEQRSHRGTFRVIEIPNSSMLQHSKTGDKTAYVEFKTHRENGWMMTME
ncbi:hypothetical protein V6N12_063837 [Hibiscus sabdariffa]|uniref:Endonuclease/exonuclease/phosphatase domain-containing protein n=1 Tax=Hibiscus sabdariffa TaxID=183260 RepID=A0ABR2ASL2_9ROSI